MSPAAVCLGREACASQSLFECGVRRPRPERGASAGPQCRTYQPKATVVVEPRVSFRGQRCWSVIDIEDDRVETSRTAANHLHNVLLQDGDTRVRHGWPCKRICGIPVPLNHRRENFRGHNNSVRLKTGKSRFKREAKAKTADQHSRALFSLEVRAGQPGDFFFRGMAPGRHELHRTRANTVNAVVLAERDNCAIRSGCLLEQIPLFQTWCAVCGNQRLARGYTLRALP